jgi:hypothetical protein
MNNVSSIVLRDRMLMTLRLERHESVLILCLCNRMFTRLCLERHESVLILCLCNWMFTRLCLELSATRIPHRLCDGIAELDSSLLLFLFHHTTAPILQLGVALRPGCASLCG